MSIATASTATTVTHNLQDLPADVLGFVADLLLDHDVRHLLSLACVSQAAARWMHVFLRRQLVCRLQKEKLVGVMGRACPIDAPARIVRLKDTATAIALRLPCLRILRIGNSAVRINKLRHAVKSLPTNARYTKHIRLSSELEACDDEGLMAAVVSAHYLLDVPKQPWCADRPEPLFAVSLHRSRDRLVPRTLLSPTVGAPARAGTAQTPTRAAAHSCTRGRTRASRSGSRTGRTRPRRWTCR